MDAAPFRTVAISCMIATRSTPSPSERLSSQAGSRRSCVYRISDSAWTRRTDGISSRPDEGSVQADLGVLASLFKSRAKLEAENLVLRQQINVLRRRAPKRPHLNSTDRFLFGLYHWFPSVLGAIAIVRPKTIIRWHRAGFRAYWRWRSRNAVGRPKVSIALRTLIGEMSRANPLWGAPHIHGELLKLGFEVAQST